MGFSVWKVYNHCSTGDHLKWFEMLENGNEVGAMFFDFRKVFDSDPHRALLGKLENLQVNYLLVK